MLAALILTLMFGTVDLTDGCVEDGQPGLVNAIGECVTEAEYAAMLNPDSLVTAGVADSYTDHGDGTVTLHAHVPIVVEADPLRRPIGTRTVDDATPEPYVTFADLVAAGVAA